MQTGSNQAGSASDNGVTLLDCAPCEEKVKPETTPNRWPRRDANAAAVVLLVLAFLAQFTHLIVQTLHTARQAQRIEACQVLADDYLRLRTASRRSSLAHRGSNRIQKPPTGDCEIAAGHQYEAYAKQLGSLLGVHMKDMPAKSNWALLKASAEFGRRTRRLVYIYGLLLLGALTLVALCSFGRRIGLRKAALWGASAFGSIALLSLLITYLNPILALLLFGGLLTVGLRFALARKQAMP